YPVLGTTGSPQFDLNTVAVSSGGPATLDIGLSASGYTFAPGGAIFEIGGTTAGKVSAEAFSGSDYFDTANPLGSEMMFVSPGVVSGSVNGTVPASPNPYSLSIYTEIDHKGAGITSFDANLTVPEPTTLLFLGFGIVGLVGLRRKFQE
ncbi:MAG TPA: PEP-CTERM sorting domain-containing protein, partial [Syntrophorhabdales bacterium]|nr:PEP-CTERM sorting domain-containing protein [Syntrophorhabdales bacterium]